jgi:hypothetical protein
VEPPAGDGAAVGGADVDSPGFGRLRRVLSLRGHRGEGDLEVPRSSLRLDLALEGWIREVSLESEPVPPRRERPRREDAVAIDATVREDGGAVESEDDEVGPMGGLHARRVPDEARDRGSRAQRDPQAGLRYLHGLLCLSLVGVVDLDVGASAR